MAYWFATFTLLVLGFLTGFSIGPFLLLVALAMLVLGPFRRRPRIYWPPMAAVLGFLVGYLAVAPLYCTASSIGGADSTVCSSLFGIKYAGSDTYNPPLLPGLSAGLVLAAITGLTVAVIMWASARRSSSERRAS
jgi:hypothetical protein